MGSGLILLLLVGAWLAVLVPMALRSHDPGTLGTVDRFHDAMRVLSRRDSVPRPVPPTGEAAEPAPDDAPPATVVAPPTPDGVPAQGTPSVQRRGPSAATRRLRALLVLLVLAVGTLVAGVLVTPWVLVAHALVDLALVGFVCWLRSRAIARAEREWRIAMGERRPTSRTARVGVLLPELDEADEPAAASSVRVAPGRVAGIPDRMPSRWDLDPALVPPQADEPDVEQVAARGAQGEPWQPVPVPVPTYVTAARAPRRVVDLTRVPSEALVHAERSLGIDDRGPGLERTLDRCRAVGD